MKAEFCAARGVGWEAVSLNSAPSCTSLPRSAHPRQEAVVLRISVVQIEINLVCFTFIFVPFPKSFNFFPGTQHKVPSFSVPVKITIIVPLPINHRSSSADTKLQKNCKPRSTITVIITATSYCRNITCTTASSYNTVLIMYVQYGRLLAAICESAVFS